MMSNLWIISIFALLITSGCSADFANMAEKRLEHARRADAEGQDIHIVAINDAMESDYIKGIMLAAEEINSQPDKLLNRNVNITIEDPADDLPSSRSLIHKIVSNPEVVAVLGHRSSNIAVPASVIYEKSQVIYMPPFATAQALTSHNFQYVFRMLPSNKAMTEQLGSVASTLGYKNIVVLYARDDFNRELAFLFEDAIIKQKINIVKRSSFFAEDTNYRSIISQFNSENFDSVFIASSGDSTALMVKQMREMGLNQPILGSDSVNKQSYIEITGSAADKTTFPSIYNAKTNNSQKNRLFLEKFKEKYSKEPDYNAAQGYDSLMLLSEAIKRSKSTVTATISSTLHFMPTWAGITGLHKFDQFGELLGKNYLFNAWNDGEIHALPALHNRYLLERFDSTLAPGNSFSSLFSSNMHEDDHKLQMLSLAYAILKFKRIGIIYEDTEAGRRKSGFDLLASLAKKTGIEIAGCKIPFSLLDNQVISKRMIDCYGRLSLNIDVLFTPLKEGVDPGLLRELSASLAFFKIPAIALDTQNMDSHTSLAITKRVDVNKHSIRAYNGLLGGLKIHEFSEKIKGIPDIYINLRDLQRMGIAEKEILLLSPDYLLSPDDGGKL